MKKFGLFILLCGFLASCTESNRFTIKGSVDKSFYGDSIYLCTIPDIDTVAAGYFIDSTTFVLEGDVQESLVVFLKSSSHQTTTAFVLEKGRMKVEEVNDTLFLVSGTPLNDVFSRFLIENENVSQDSLISGMEKLMIEHSSDALGTLLGRSIAYAIEPEEYVDLYYRMDSHMRDDPFFAKLHKRSIRNLISIGSMFSEVIGEVDGKQARLSDYAGRGSWVLLSFWASWCGDCAEEMPKLRKMYETLKQDQINIIGISCRDEMESMKRAIKKYDIIWPVFNNTKGLETTTYGIITIPALVLVDPDGVVVASGTTCDEFLEKIKKAQASYNAN